MSGISVGGALTGMEGLRLLQQAGRAMCGLAVVVVGTALIGMEELRHTDVDR